MSVASSSQRVPAQVSMTSSKPSIADCDKTITAPGGVLEMEETVISGRPMRVWKNLPPTFRSFLLSSLDKYANRQFVSSPLDPTSSTSISGGGEARENVTFAEVKERSIKFAAWLRSHGVVKGSRVAIGGSNCTWWITAFVASHLLGAVPVFLNASLERDGLIHCLSVTRPLIVLVDADVAQVIGPARPLLKQRRVGPIYCWSPTWSLPVSARRGISEIGPLDPPRGLVRDVIKGAGLRGLGPESDAVIFFTSGTGGFPKAVLSTQRMALSNIFSGLVAPARAALRAGRPIPPLPAASDPQRTVLLSIPLFHVTGCLSWLMRSFFSGNRLVLMRRWSVKSAVGLIQSERVNVVGGVPAVVSMLLQSPLLPPSVQFDTIFYGGAPPPERLAADVKRRWPKAGLVQGYGMTETNAYVCSVAGPDYLDRPGSTGPPVPVCDVKVVDPETRQSLKVGEEGLLLVRGPQVMKGYFGDREATAVALDADGWIDTGDLASVDQDGFVYIRDRLKDVIIRGGENIASAEVENALYEDPRIAEAAAVAVPDPVLGERVGAVVSLTPGTEGASVESILETVKGRLRHAARPVVLIIHPTALPRNVNGKLVKRQIKGILADAVEAKNRDVGAAMVRAKL